MFKKTVSFQQYSNVVIPVLNSINQYQSYSIVKSRQINVYHKNKKYEIPQARAVILSQGSKLINALSVLGDQDIFYPLWGSIGHSSFQFFQYLRQNNLSVKSPQLLAHMLKNFKKNEKIVYKKQHVDIQQQPLNNQIFLIKYDEYDLKGMKNSRKLNQNQGKAYTFLQNYMYQLRTMDYSNTAQKQRKWINLLNIKMIDPILKLFSQNKDVKQFRKNYYNFYQTVLEKKKDFKQQLEQVIKDKYVHQQAFAQQLNFGTSNFKQSFSNRLMNYIKLDHTDALVKYHYLKQQYKNILFPANKQQTQQSNYVSIKKKKNNENVIYYQLPLHAFQYQQKQDLNSQKVEQTFKNLYNILITKQIQTSQFMQRISKVYSLMKDYDSSAPQQLQFKFGEFSQNNPLSLYISGQKVWGMQQSGIQGKTFARITQPTKFSIKIDIPSNFHNSESFANFLSNIKQAIISRIAMQTQNYYIGLSPIMHFNRVHIRYPNRQAAKNLLKAFLNTNSVILKYKKQFEHVTSFLLELMHDPDKARANLTYVHGWFKKNIAKKPKKKNCVIQSLSQICKTMKIKLTGQQWRLIRQGELLTICYKHNIPFYLSTQPTKSVYPNFEHRQMLYILPCHTYVVNSKKFMRKRKYQGRSFGAPRSGKISVKQSLLQNSICFDLQTYAVQQIKQQVYLLCWWGYISGKQVSGTISTSISRFKPQQQILNQFIEYVLLQCSLPQRLNQPLYVYSYNGPKFQFKYLLKRLLRYVPQIQSFGSANASKGLVCLDGRLHFRDAKFLFGGGSLKDNTKTYNSVQDRKIDLPKQQLPKTPEQYFKNKQKIDKYCMQDSRSTIILIRNYYQKLQKMLSQIAPIRQQQWNQFYADFTASQIGLHILQRVFCTQSKIQQQLNHDILKRQKQSNYGGMVGCNIPHFTQKVVGYDISAAYPAAMCQQLPFSRISSIIPPRNNQKQCIRKGMKDCLLALYTVTNIRISPAFQKFLPYRKKDGLLYLQQIKDHLQLWGHSLQYILQTGGSFDIIQIVRYSHLDANRKPVQGFRNFSNSIFNLRKVYKQKAKLDQNDTSSAAYSCLLKLLLNSPYGKFNQRKYPKKKIVSQQNIFLHVQQCYQYKYFNGVGQVTYQSNIQFNSGNLVRFSSYITSLVRLKLAKAIDIVGWSNVIYYDTDSIYFYKRWEYLFLLANITGKGILGKFQYQNKIYTQGISLGPKTRIFKKQNGELQVRSKGVMFSTDPEKRKQQIQYLYQSALKAIYCNQLCIPCKKIYVCSIDQNKRWMWDQQRQGNVIQTYQKKVHYYHKKRYQNGLLYAMNWEQSLKYCK